MKKFLKIFGAVVIAAALTAGGYIAGSQNGMDSISSALPHVNITHGSPHASGEPLDKLLPPEEPTEPEKTGRTVVKTNESAAGGDWTLIKSYNGYLTGNENKATVSLYTSAQTVNGEIAWDDGQQWVVEISDGKGGYYTLMDQYICGNVYLEVTEADGNTAVNVFTKTSACMEIKQYTYSENGFTETTLYNSGAVNTLFSSIPDYQ